MNAATSTVSMLGTHVQKVSSVGVFRALVRSSSLMTDALDAAVGDVVVLHAVSAEAARAPAPIPRRCRRLSSIIFSLLLTVPKRR